MNKNKWFLNGGRGSGKSIRLLCETYENKIVELQNKVDTLQGFLDHDIEYDMDKTIQEQKIKIAELEKENAELKTKKIPQLERRIASIRGSHSVDAKKLNARIEQVERLKKENAELKEQCSILADCNTCVSDCKTENIEIKKQLTKAKELLKEFNQVLKERGFYHNDLYKRTEQFISEVEK